VQIKHITDPLLVPTLPYRLLDINITTVYDLSSPRTLVDGAAPMAPAAVEGLVKEFGQIFVQLYGSSEDEDRPLQDDQLRRRNGLCSRWERCRGAWSGSRTGSGRIARLRVFWFMTTNPDAARTFATRSALTCAITVSAWFARRYSHAAGHGRWRLRLRRERLGGGWRGQWARQMPSWRCPANFGAVPSRAGQAPGIVTGKEQRSQTVVLFLYCARWPPRFILPGNKEGTNHAR
jgi:hypothetical protein